MSTYQGIHLRRRRRGEEGGIEVDCDVVLGDGIGREEWRGIGEVDGIGFTEARVREMGGMYGWGWDGFGVVDRPFIVGCDRFNCRDSKGDGWDWMGRDGMGLVEWTGLG